MTATDTQLLEGARAGEREAIEALLERYQARVFRFGMKMCRDREDAQDVLQETLIAMARALPDFRAESSVSSWAYAIARSFCIKHRRRSKFAPEHEASVESDVAAEVRALESDDDPERNTAGRELGEVLDEAIASLDDKYREVLVLRDVEGLTAPEVGEVLGLSVAAVKSRLHRARTAIRDRLAPLLEAPDAPAPAATCPDTALMLSRHLEGDLDPDACADMERHLEECAGCHSRCEVLRTSLAACKAAPAPVVPPEVQEAVRRAIRAFLDPA